MRIRQFVRLAGLFAAVAGEICQDCSNDDRLFTNVTILEAPYKNVAAAGPPPPPPPPRTPPPGLPDRPPPNPQNEPATDEVWDRCRRKGCTLSWAMSHDDSEVGPQYDPGRTTAASPFQTIGDLHRWNWMFHDLSHVDDYYFDFYRTWGIGDALASLGINPDASRYQGGQNHIVNYQHFTPIYITALQDQRYDVNGKQYRSTGAEFTFSLNIKDGVIMGMDRTSPREAGKTKVSPPITGDGLPKLNQFSDVAWLDWQFMIEGYKGDVKNIKYFISVLIVNPETRAVAMRALRTRSKIELEDFPGQTFERGTDEMNALMGTPNMQGFAYMLVQHKAQLGNMYIKKIQVFKCVTMREPPCMIAYVSKPDAAPVTNPGEGEGEVVRRDGGRNMARMHKIFAKL